MHCIGYYYSQVLKFQTKKNVASRYVLSSIVENDDFLSFTSLVMFMQDPTATIGEGCRIGPNVVIGPSAVIQDGKYKGSFPSLCDK